MQFLSQADFEISQRALGKSQRISSKKRYIKNNYVYLICLTV